MKKILLDTNAYGAFKKDDSMVTGVIRSVEYIGLSVVVLGELLGGFKGGSKEEKNIEELNEFMDSPRVHLLPVDEETAEFYAKVYRDLKKKGKPIPSNDMWIAASALRHGLSLLTLDEHFNHIDGLILKSKAL
ncbi:MAG: type II toxin-antitoxin system VapC family toxin [Nitrospirae bacterium]|nr:type II toxin-antitoxin system VapC family toxin [Nitrospirota bacterium]